ncbi:DUF6213 family protein [Streptomyces sp. NPDC008121]|uniref:DUF6213 family protein n=1 Tax=Streptomyces sp. NPDC008121 TaxID=3364809 RepID=UPI0036E4C917
MIQMSIPLVPTADGGLLIPAGHVTALLRGLAVDWVEAGGSGEMRGDERTIRELAAVLTELADQVDVECIGFASEANEPETDRPDTPAGEGNGPEGNGPETDHPGTGKPRADDPDTGDQP